MKFYTKPEIEALALETVDVIETSSSLDSNAAAAAAVGVLGATEGVTLNAQVQVINTQVAEMSTNWQW